MARLLCALEWGHWGWGFAEDVFVVPVEVALVAVVDEGGAGEAVELAGVDDQLGGHVERAQGLIHLFAAYERNVHVLVSAHKEGWSFDLVGVIERIGELDVCLL